MTSLFSGLGFVLGRLSASLPIDVAPPVSTDGLAALGGVAIAGLCCLVVVVIIVAALVIWLVRKNKGGKDNA